jgi:hypothetical protein
LGFVTTACVVTFAQTQPFVSSRGAFSSINQDLSEAADRALATVLVNRSWMNAEGSSSKDGKVRSALQTDSTLKLRGAIDRVNRLRPLLEPILRDEGVPVELSAVVLVESGGLPAALSPKGARGVWQFMPDTARRYGLIVDGSRDERLDVVKSTHAAAQYLRDLRLRFGDWRLALAAYNAGELTVSRAIERNQSSDVDLIFASKYLPAEPRSYVPAINASMNRLYYGTLSSASRDISSTNIVYASPALNER